MLDLPGSQKGSKEGEMLPLTKGYRDVECIGQPLFPSKDNEHGRSFSLFRFILCHCHPFVGSLHRNSVSSRMSQCGSIS
jgi:hypothetical protein